MIRCVAIDDEPLALRQIATYIKKVPYLELTQTFNDALKAQQWLLNNDIDLIFIDINMPDLTGTNLVRSLVTPPMVIFTTAYSEYAVEGFKLDAIDYLLKPFSFEELARSAAKAHTLHQLRQLQLNAQADAASHDEEENESRTTNDKEYISVRADHKTSLVKLANIVYLESEGEYVCLHLNDGTKLITLFRLKNMETVLPSETFMRVHRSYIINLSYISGYTKGRVFLAGEEYVPIGENYKENFMSYISEKF
jgi:two-component system LytT family response regulator